MPVWILERNIDFELYFLFQWLYKDMNIVFCIMHFIFLAFDKCIDIFILKHNSYWNKFSDFLVLFDNLHFTSLIFSIFQVCSILNYYTCCVDMIIVVSDGSITNFWRSFCINYMKEEKKREALNEARAMIILSK